METTTYLLIVLAAVVALLLAVFQYIFKSKEKGHLSYWLSFLRFLSIFSIFLLIINPSIEKKRIEEVKPKLVLAVDNSTSIKYNSLDTTITDFVNQIRSDTELTDKFSMHFFGFGSDVYALDSLNFTDYKTDLSIPFKEFSAMFKSEAAPVILITDGNQTIGKNVEFVNYKSPVYPFIVGDTMAFEDIAITQLNINKNTYLNNLLPVELFVVYSGKDSITKQLTVYQKGSIIYSEKLQLSKENNVEIASFFLTATENGTQFYTARIEELNNEQNTFNNSKNFSINVIDEQSEILILATMMHPDIGMLKKSIESNKQRLVEISSIADFKGDITDYELIILYQPSNNFESIFKEIDINKLNYLIVSGSNTDWNFLNAVQNNFKKVAILDTENYSPIFNPNYASFLINDIGFSTFTPLEDKFGQVSFLIPYNALLFQRIGLIETENPLLATFESNNQKGAILLGENIWRWRMSSFSEFKTFDLFDGFMSNLVQYMSSDLNKKRLNVTGKPMYYTNEIIQISASYLDENFNFEKRAKLWLTVANRDNNFLKKIPFVVGQNTFNVALSNIPFGEYIYTVSVENQEDRSQGSFNIVPFEVEQQFTNSNDTQLKILADRTNGKIFYNEQENNLINELKSDARYNSMQHISSIKTPLINWQWILGLIILTLSIEWFTRKYFGRI
jgi:hypothetical protein